MSLFSRQIPALERSKRPYLIPTSVTPLESAVLFKMANEAGTVLEVGAWHGYSTILMAIAGAMVYSVDPHTADGADTWPTFQANLAEWHVEDRVTALREQDLTALPRLIRQAARFDAAFIDGDHSHEAVCFDVRACRQLVRPGGYIALHDYVDAWPGVVSAVTETLADVNERELVGNLLLVRLPKHSR